MSGILNDFRNLKSAEEASLEDSPVLESEITLAAIREGCSSDAEFAELIGNAATEMALHGVISDADIATEVSKRILITDFKAANYNRIEKRTAIRLAMINNDQLYVKYRKYRDLFLKTRQAIYKKYGARARVEAKRIIRNSHRKAGNMTSAAGRTIVDKIDKQIDKATADAKDNA